MGRRFDKNSSGRITPADFTDIAGLGFDGATSASLLFESDTLNGSFGFTEFAEYVKSPTKQRSAWSRRSFSRAGLSDRLADVVYEGPVFTFGASDKRNLNT